MCWAAWSRSARWRGARSTRNPARCGWASSPPWGRTCSRTRCRWCAPPSPSWSCCWSRKKPRRSCACCARAGSMPGFLPCRDFGDRSNRKHARFKYTLDDLGLDWFKAELETRLGWRLQPAQPFHFEDTGDRFGWVQDGRGQWHLTLCVPSGRLRDTPEAAWLTGLREIARVHEGDFRLTTNQNLTIARIDKSQKRLIE